ncbi:MAG TPA: enhanced serine sensitivity protein SseB C-terminal domain-containing protein, partial [Steroidobacteraceae bacterium]
MLHPFMTPEVTFLGEQDGPAERRLKEALSVLLDLGATVTRAYLARVSYDDKTSGMMLGLLTEDERNSEKVAGQMGRTFEALFNTRAHLEIMCLDDERDAEIRKACAPFYDR